MVGALTRSRIINSLFVVLTLPTPPAQPLLLRSGRRRHALRFRDRVRRRAVRVELRVRAREARAQAHVEVGSPPLPQPTFEIAPELAELAAREGRVARRFSPLILFQAPRSATSPTGRRPSRTTRNAKVATPKLVRAGVNRDVHSPARLLVVQLTIDDEDRVSDERYRRMDGEVDRRLRLAGVEDAGAGDRVGQLKMENTLCHSIVDVTCSIPPTARSRQTRFRESFPPFGTWGSRTARSGVLSKHRRNTAQMGKKMVVRVVLHERNKNLKFDPHARALRNNV